MSYVVGDRPKIESSTAFHDNITDVDIDPTTVTFTIRDPSGNTTPYVYGEDAEVVKVATGDYYMLVNADEAGMWRYRIEGVDGDGNYMGADEGSLEVEPSMV